MAKERRSALKSIKEFCRICNGVPAGGDYTPVRECTAGPDRKDGLPPCVLWPYRMGVTGRELSAERKAALVENVKKAQEAKKAAA